MQAPVQPAEKPKPAEEVKVLATPAVRALAQKMKVDITKVTPTGKGGKTTQEDVLKYAEMQAAPKSIPAAPQEVAHVGVETPLKVGAGDQVVKISGLWRDLMRSMTNATTIPHYNLQEEFGAERLLIARKNFLDSHPGQKITFLPYFIKVFSQVLIEFPIFNGYSSDKVDRDGYVTEYTEKADHNFAIVIDTPKGIVIPNLKSVQNKSITQINIELRELIERARNEKLTPEDLAGGTFCISNLGKLGAQTGAPLIFNRMISIASIGPLRIIPEFVKNKKGETVVGPKDIMSLSISCDHRIVDGATGARFASRVKHYLESIDSLLLNLK